MTIYFLKRENWSWGPEASFRKEMLKKTNSSQASVWRPARLTELQFSSCPTQNTEEVKLVYWLCLHKTELCIDRRICYHVKLNSGFTQSETSVHVSSCLCQMTHFLLSKQEADDSRFSNNTSSTSSVRSQKIKSAARKPAWRVTNTVFSLSQY